jgi:hypothetical protein
LLWEALLLLRVPTLLLRTALLLVREALLLLLRKALLLRWEALRLLQVAPLLRRLCWHRTCATARGNEGVHLCGSGRRRRRRCKRLGEIVEAQHRPRRGEGCRRRRWRGRGS